MSRRKTVLQAMLGELQQTSKDLRNHEREEKSLDALVATRDRWVRSMPSRRSLWTPRQRQAIARIDARIQTAVRRSEKATKEIEERQEVLRVSIETEEIYRKDTMETRRRQQAKSREVS